MKESQHTPGPWRIGDGSFIICDTPVCPASEDSLPYYGGHLVCESVAPQNMDLIAAAPDILEALEAILADDMGDSKSAQEFGGFVLPDELRNKARAAIAKAKP